MPFHPFQIEDYAAAAMVDGAVLAHDTGLGKSLAAATYPLLKCGFDVVYPSPRLRGEGGREAPGEVSRPIIHIKAPVLIIAPGDLHSQLCAEFKKFYGIVPTSIADQAELSRLLVNGKMPPGFYITSYTRLAVNGVQKISALAKLGTEAAAMALHLKAADLRGFYEQRALRYRDEYATLGVRPDCTGKQIDAALAAKVRALKNCADDEIASVRRGELERCHNLLSNFILEDAASLGGDARRPSDLPKIQFIWKELIRHKLEEYSDGIGEIRPAGGVTEEEEKDETETEIEAEPKFVHNVKCVYSPSMADLGSHLFECVVVDEGVKMKGAYTAVGQGIRQMCPRYRLVLTATPVKNRLPDLFFLAWWAAGGHAEATPRWPYAGGAEEQEQFANTFMLSEFNKTKAEQDPGKKSRYKKLRPEICNVHLLWKALGPIILRRRKQDIGQSIVRKIRHVYRVPMGLHQRAVYRYHLESDYLDCNRRPAPGAKLQALRVAAAAPDSHLLDPQPGGDCRECCSNPDFSPSPLHLPLRSGERDGVRCQECEVNTTPVCRNCGSPPLIHRSPHSFTPKVATALTLVRDILQRGEQVAVFSAFNDPSDILSRYLDGAGLAHYLLDGRMNQAKRGVRSAAFNNGDCPITLAGIDSMAEGHNWDHVNNIILTSYTWAADKVVQAINRAHRLTSRRDVNLYVIICDQSADRVLEDNICEKTNSSELAIDGRLLGEVTEERSIGELLRDAMRDFHSKQDCPNEEVLAKTWPTLRSELQAAGRHWLEGAEGGEAKSKADVAAILNLEEFVFPQPLAKSSQNITLSSPQPSYIPSWRRLRVVA